MLWTHRTEDAEVILSGMGSLAAEATVAADALREEGIRAGVVGIRVYRPFPAKEAVEAFRGAKAIVLFEKSISYGYEGGLCSDLKAAFYGSGISAATWRASAAAISALDGTHPVFTQVPPNVPRSTITTDLPSVVARIAAANAAPPDPITARSIFDCIPNPPRTVEKSS